MNVIVGERLRQARAARQMSLADVAAEAKVSAATLSRVERDKQAIDVGLFLTLANVLNVTPADLLKDADDSAARTLAARVASMQSRERTQFWHQLNEERRGRRAQKRMDLRDMGMQVEELLAQMDLLREEIESVRARLTTKR
ncbi:MAG TPA: helix-turn-helix domain-containing protein [Thermoanaerobaculia bacterium]|nr:helix-turn-helix domain-containing protein [Thermoanaerobaculia bacterium]